MIRSLFLKIFITNLILEIQLNLSKKPFEEAKEDSEEEKSEATSEDEVEFDDL